MTRLCQHLGCPNPAVPLDRSERKYHTGACKRMAKLIADRERAARNYAAGRECANDRPGSGPHGELRWSRTAPVGLDSYLAAEAILCSERCFIEFYDDLPELTKPEAYWLIKGMPKDKRPTAKPIKEILLAGLVTRSDPDRSEDRREDGALLDWLTAGAGHRHRPGRKCAVCF